MKISALLLAGLVAGAPLMASAEDAPEEIIKYRESVMKAYAGHAGAAARLVRGKVSFDNLKLHAGAMRDLSLLVGELFPPDSDFGETRAKPEVWSKRDEFDKAVKENQAAAEAFAKAAESGDMQAAGEAFGTLSDSCKSCHESFRTEE